MRKKSLALGCMVFVLGIALAQNHPVLSRWRGKR